MNKKTSSKQKKRNWVCVLYPESMPENWKELLQLSGLKIALSPLHDKDKNSDGTQKKAHYHMIYIYGGPTTYNNAYNFSAKLGGTIPQALEQIRGYYRYFTHEDNPEKAQYSKNDIQVFNGFSINDYVDITFSEKIKLKQEIFDFIRLKNITEYSILIDMIEVEGTVEQFDIATSNTILFNNYLKSKRHFEEKKEIKKKWK